MDDTSEELKNGKRERISKHNADLQRISSLALHGSLNNWQLIAETRREPSVQKPWRPAPLGELQPIHCSSLAINTVHNCRVLRGKLIVDPLIMTAAFTIIEDEVGDVVPVSIYNFAPTDFDRLQRQNRARCLFSSGKMLSIIEPYYKIASDSSRMIRVDNFAQDVIFLDRLGPQSSAGWRDEGKTHFEKRQFREAMHCYRRSIDTHTSSKLTATLLSNIATSFMLKKEHLPSLLFAAAAFIADDSLFRPYYTAGFVLNKMHRSDLAFNCLERCRQLKAPTKLCKQLQAGFRNIGQPKHVAAARWNEEVLRIVCSENVKHLLRIESDAVMDSSYLKERGNELFRKGNYDECIREYCMGLRAITEVATLLNNRGMCFASVGRHAEAALHASAAILVTPSLAKAHYWKTISLMQLSYKNEVRMCYESAKEVVGDRSILESLANRISCCLSVPSADDPVPQTWQRRCSRDEMTEREQEAMFREGSLSSTATAEFNERIQLISSYLPGARRLMRYFGLRVDNRVAPFHLEFSRRGNWPLECDAESCMELLKRAYENARTPESHIPKESESKSHPDIMDVCKRLRSTRPNVIKWWNEGRRESISPRVRHSYTSNLHDSFTSTPCWKVKRMAGRVHVSVGFVDLSGLLCSRLMASAASSLRWIGYESSAYSVAKTEVIAQMMRQQADTNDILQVWYSSSWTMKTLHSFRTALNELTDNTIGFGTAQCSRQVAMLWQHWQQFDVPLHTARSKWVSRHNLRNNVEIANFRRKIDRVALCRYLVSGEVLEGTVGSVVMFGLPENNDERKCDIALDEWFFRCLSTRTILKEMDSKTDVINAAIRILHKRISALKQQVCSGEVEIELRHRAVTAFDKRTLNEIKSLSPHTITWSNLCDYCSNKQFHDMARACSASDTIHCLTTVNWSTEVKGTFLMDYKSESQREMLDTAKAAVSFGYRVTRMETYLHDPPITHSYNVASFALGLSMNNAWIENFFSPAAMLHNRKKQLAVIAPAVFDVLARAPSIFYIIYTFNPNIDLWEDDFLEYTDEHYLKTL